ncbi:MAG TPA: glycoside hydrolase family 3 C-terminal domain-containing protein [Terriglobia bacterium]|nr:glycoside hydrolase family 3 C-terminal domain-containing protein [Terriglobia bacterium]
MPHNPARFHSCRPVRRALLVALEATLSFTLGCSARHVSNRASKVDQLLSKMTLAQKIRMIHGEQEPPATSQGQGGYMAGDPKLGIPWLRLADGPPGILTRHRSTAPTCTMGLGATFSVEDARLNGVVIGRDARALGIDITLQPFINIMRDPTWSRAYNLYGEDPLVVGEIGAAEVRGIQNQGVMAMAKHYLAYNGGDNVVAGQQALHEIYAAPFANAVKAGVATIMCSYNEVNGAFSCGNPDALQTLLKQEIGFKGFVTSDWRATHATTFVNNGLDLEMPGYPIENVPCFFCAVPPPLPPPPPPPPMHLSKPAPPYAWPAPTPEEPPRYYLGSRHYEHSDGMLAAIKSGQVKPATITAAARRILQEEDRFGWLTGHVKHSVTPVPFAEDVKVVEKTSEDSAVLLKNQDHGLPLNSRDLKSLALIGPGAGQTITIGLSMEKALGFPSRDLGPLAALKQATASVPGRRIIYAVADDMTGSPIPASDFSYDGKPGLLRENERGHRVGIDSELDFTKKNGHALPTGSSFSWRGTLEIPKTGVYWIYLQLMGCSAQLEIDGTPIGHSSGLFMHGDYIQAAEDNVLPTTDNLDNVRRAVHLTAGDHSLVVTEKGDGSDRPVQLRLNWMPPHARQADYLAALQAARRAKKVIIFAWARCRPDFDLPGDQDKLISAIAKINPNTIVVLNSSQPFALPWLNQVKAVLEMWYPGDGGGVATANVLLGRTDPAGRLPFTWAQRLDQYVSHDPAHPERSSDGVHGVTTFSEGIFVGYRWFDEQHIQPLFPFGYGLSYTRFRYSDLQTQRAPDGGFIVRFVVQNVGKVYGDEVPQVYLGPPESAPSGAEFAVRALAGFNRIGLNPGESRQVEIHVPLRQLQYWSDAASGWEVATGSRNVYVGASSRDLRLHEQITVP